MKLDKQLNIVIPFEDNDETVYFHSMPVMREVFERYWRVMAKAHARLMQDDTALACGDRIAALALKEAALELKQWDGSIGVQNGLLNEIKRLTTVLTMTETGWQALPVSAAVAQNLIDEAVWQEVEDKLVFFTLMSQLLARKNQPLIQAHMTAQWDAQFVSSLPMDYLASLPTSTQAETLPPQADSSAPCSILS